MPLPDRNMVWPPLELAVVADSMELWSAWYSGAPEQLELAYKLDHRGIGGGRHYGEYPANRPSQFRGGVVGAVARTFWGAPRHDWTQGPKQKLHIPLAGDICQASADLLFADPPTIKGNDKGSQDRLAELLDDGMTSTLAEAAELAAALGGVYLRVTWDEDTQPDGPFLTAVDADGAWPEFQWGRLRAVTFWTDVTPSDQRNGDLRLRHLERHELDSTGNGIILHGLYQGTRENLGRNIPLTDVQVTSDIADQLDDGQQISTESPGLAVVYVPNQRPQRRWRHDPVGRNLGRSDLDGVEGLMDALDETYTSWMRDIRLGKGRVFVAQSMLQSNGPGKGASWDPDQEIYAPLDMPPGSMNPNATNGSGLITPQQFKIRFQEHSSTANELVQNILRTSGYSTQTFGINADTARDTTATEVQARQQRSYMTRDRKIRLWRPALQDAVAKLLAVDKAIFGGDVTVDDPEVVFSDGVQESQISIAQTAQALYTANAASRKTLVAMVHPDWDETQVQAEVALIDEEQAKAAPVHDPFADPTLPPNQ